MDIVTEIINITDINDEYILYNHNFIKLQIEKALNIVKKYIIVNNLLIVGGTAIDYALKLKNKTLYNDLYQIPDFDIISPDNIKHANNIGQLLCNEKFENISIVPAIHHTTVRVQLLGFTVFDSTYVPEYIYKKIPYMEYKEFKFVDPNFQKINQYLSLSFLFKITGPSYNITNRFKKDVERFQLLENEYDLNNIYNNNFLKVKSLIDDKSIFTFDIKNIKIDEIKILNFTECEKISNVNDNINKINNFNNLLNENTITDNNDYSISYNIKSNLVFHGVLAYNIIYKEFNKIYDKLTKVIDITNDDKIKLNSLYKNITIKSKYTHEKNNISFDIVNGLEICFINNDNTIDELTELFKKNYTLSNIKKMDNILDFKPKYIDFLIDNLETKIYDLYGDLPSINLIYDEDIRQLIPVTSFAYNLMYFLTNYYLEEDNNKKLIYLSYYESLKSIIHIVQLIYFNYPGEFLKSNNFTNSCFNFSINTLGDKNYPDNFYYFIENFEFLVQKNKNMDILPPKNYIGYPNCNIKNIFNFDNSPYYNDQQAIIKHTNYSNLN